MTKATKVAHYAFGGCQTFESLCIILKCPPLLKKTLLIQRKQYLLQFSMNSFQFDAKFGTNLFDRVGDKWEKMTKIWLRGRHSARFGQIFRGLLAFFIQSMV
jgi:hypothetical protein